MQRSKDIKTAPGSHLGKTPSAISPVPEAEEGVVQVFFRISPELHTRIGHAIADARCSRRELWIAAMEAFLGQATEPREAVR